MSAMTLERLRPYVLNVTALIGLLHQQPVVVSVFILAYLTFFLNQAHVNWLLNLAVVDTLPNLIQRVANVVNGKDNKIRKTLIFVIMLSREEY